MNKNKKKNRIYRSMKEFEKEFLPKSFEKIMVEKPKDAQALGVSLARESLDKIRERLAEI